MDGKNEICSPASQSGVERPRPIGPQPALLADSLEMIGLRSWIPGRLDLKSPWGVSVAGRPGWIYLSGRPCLLAFKNDPLAVSIPAGDLVIVFPNHEHRLLEAAGNPTVPMQEMAGKFHFEDTERLLTGREAAGFSVICGCFLLEDFERTLLHAVLPATIRIRGDGRKPPPHVEQVLRLILQEAVSSEPCAALIINRLVRILLIKALQAHVTNMSAGDGNWLRAITDPQIGRALALMHEQPEAPWTVASLAAKVAMSRSVFSARFTTMVGKPPLEYLSEWRMQKAAYWLRGTRGEMKEVAAKVGYESASAFSKAFARWAGIAPSAYREAAHAQAASQMQ